MAIVWTEYAPNTWNQTVVRTWTTHEGLVVEDAWRREQRVMSDVYADVSYCRVWNPETKMTEVVNIGTHFECCNTFGKATVDAPADILEERDRQVAAANLQRVLAERSAAEIAVAERKAAMVNFPERGKVMRVVRGRKVPVGTVGEVFWMDNPRRPTRVGLALDNTRNAKGSYANVAWVDAAYLVAA